METSTSVANPGSALGEAIGNSMEIALNKLLKPIAEENDCIYISAGPKNKVTQQETKLLLKDSSGTEYNIDSVITNKRLQPLILLESKYIRYTKHNRDKGSWVCTAHQSLRRRFSSVRSSITILAGNWSKTSKAMMSSFNITLFEVPFSKICDILKKYGIDFNWEEKEREKAYKAWKIYSKLSDADKLEIGEQLILVIQEELKVAIAKILDNTVPRTINKVEIQVTTNLGESKVFYFNSVEEAMKFLQELDKDEILSTDNSPSLFESDESENENRQD